MLAPENIAKVATWFITLPFYIYALLKWRQFNEHFLIKNRFPKLSYTLFCIMFMAQTLSTVEGVGHDYSAHPHNVHYTLTLFISSLTFTISGLILFLINLIYLKWKASQSMSTSNFPHLHVPSVPTEPVKNNPTIAIKPARKARSIYRSRLSLITLCFICIGSFALCISCFVSESVHLFLSTTTYTLLCVFIAVSIWNIKYKNVQEGAGCIKECYAILIALIIQMVLQSASPDSLSQLHLLVECTTFYLLNYQAVIILYIPLYLLHKAEGTLNIDMYHKKLHERIFTTKNKRKPVKRITKPSKTTGKALTIDFVETEARESNASRGADLVRQMSCEEIPTGVLFVTESLFEFLYHNERNHEIFSDYLRFCFAIENLLFVERVSVFYQIVLEMKEEYEACKREKSGLPVMQCAASNSRSLPVLSVEVSDFVSEISSDLPDAPEPIPVSGSDIECSEVSSQEMRRLEFRYLSEVYDGYRRMVDNAVVCEDHDERYEITNTKKVLLDICQEIYDQFVSVFAETQVNLSYVTQDVLDHTLDRERGVAMNEFETYDDFLVFFDHALVETYRLMISTYRYGFKKYVKNKYEDIQLEMSNNEP